MASKTPQTIIQAVQKLMNLSVDTQIAIRRAYDDWFLKQYLADKKRDFLVTSQRLLLEEHANFGSEIATARFVVTRAHGKLRTNQGVWIKERSELPAKRDEKFAITYIDLSKSGLVTEAIDNLIGLKHVNALDLSYNPGLDDFACDMLGRQFRHSKSLKEINLSYNPYISIYGLDVLFRIPSLERISAVSTLASKHEQKDLFQLSAEIEKKCEVIL